MSLGGIAGTGYYREGRFPTLGTGMRERHGANLRA
jgi:hypothetical protein